MNAQDEIFDRIDRELSFHKGLADECSNACTDFGNGRALGIRELTDYIKPKIEELRRLSAGPSRPVEAQTPHGVGLISAERTRQKSVEGWSADHDNNHDAGEMAMAAACYATPIPIRGELPVVCNCRSAECPHSGPFPPREWRDPWPWSKEWDKRGKHGRVRQLVIAGALIAAEIDRLIRAGEAVPAPPADTPTPTYFDGAAARRELEAMGDAAIVGKKPPTDTPAKEGIE